MTGAFLTKDTNAMLLFYKVKTGEDGISLESFDKTRLYILERYVHMVARDYEQDIQIVEYPEHHDKFYYLHHDANAYYTDKGKVILPR